MTRPYEDARLTSERPQQMMI